MRRTAQYAGDLAELIDWVNLDYPESSSSAFDRKDPPPAAFVSFASSSQPAGHTRLQWWASKIRVGDELKNRTGRSDGWFPAFPHVHAWDRSIITMICYLNDCEGGELGVGGYERDDPYEFFQPAPGLCAFCNGDEWHGVKPVTAGERLAVIVTGFPPD